MDGTIVGYNLYTYCGNNPVMGYDPNGEWNWGGVILGVGIVVAAVISVSSFGVAPLIAGALAVTGSAMAYAAATDSAMVVDMSISSQTEPGRYVKAGGSTIIDFSDDGGIYSYGHAGFGFGTSSGVTYEAGIVSGFEKPEDYSKHFVDFSAGGPAGVDFCCDPTREYADTTKAYCITFSSSAGYGYGYDYYSPPIEIIKWRARNR